MSPTQPDRPVFLRFGAALALAALALATRPAPAQPPEPGKPQVISEEDAEARRDALQKQVYAAFARNDYTAAEAGLRELIPLDSDNFVPWYNLACALAQQGKLEDAIGMLQQSIARGFADKRHLESDPHLRAIRDTEAYKAIIAGWDQILDRRIDANLEAARKVFGTDESRSRYTIEKDPALRLAYITAFDPTLFAQAKDELARLTRWWETAVAPPASELPAQNRGHAAEEVANPWILVILPTRADYGRWAARRFGDSWQSVGGSYSHDNKQLVAMDLGSTLRHEYWHVLHWRDMDARAQRHPVWIMEGLCSLVEDVEPLGDDDFRPLPSWRTNMARRIARGGRLVPFDTLMSLDQKRFVTSRPLAMYAQARAMFMFLAERGKLRAWYAAYTAGFREDPTGKSAWVKVFDQPLEQTEREFRAWLLALPEVNEVVGEGAANLPFDIGPGLGDGPTIDSLPTGKARDAGFRMRDVITSLNGQPVRDLNDLARLLGQHDAGDEVQVGYRRGDRHATARIVLVGRPQ